MKLIRSLSRKRYRIKHRLFTVEGEKTVSDFLSAGFHPEFLLADSEDSGFSGVEVVTSKEMQQLSNLSSAPGVMAVFKMPVDQEPITSGKRLYLDGVSDPGNLGTIIRLCDWFQIDQLICSPDTVDCYNPKVVQASMGSLARVRPCYAEFKGLSISSQPMAATMHGKSIYELTWPESGVLVMGSESHGVGEDISQKSLKVSIPRVASASAVDSLNVSTATAIILSEWMRPTER